jgi:UDP-GlcNAc:undecaprenyl-phosphate GlcNAc-1-phosphate transferase
MIFIISLTFVCALAWSLVLTPWIREVALRRQLVDVADGARKIHAQPTPRLGGIAIVLAFCAAVALLALFAPDAIRRDDAVGLAGALAMALLGVYDDLRGADAKLKLAVQLSIALALVAAGVRIDQVALPSGVVRLGAAAPVVTVLWIVGISNAVNLIDGLDGLAAGLALVALAGVALLFAAAGQGGALTVTLALAGAVLGFLVYNRHPANIFMGDCGSLFLGAMLALTTLRAATQADGSVIMLAPVLLVAVPIFDTTAAIVRRLRRRGSPFKGDAEHVHHRIMRRLQSHRGAVIVLHATAALLAGAGVAFAVDPALAGAAVLTPMVLATLVLLAIMSRPLPPPAPLTTATTPTAPPRREPLATLPVVADSLVARPLYDSGS